MTKDTKKPKHQGAQHKAKKVFDVVRPGKSPASATSRPVIPSHKTVPDDQFVPGAPALRASDPSAKHELLNARHKKELKPLTSATDGETPAIASAPAVAPSQQAIGAPAMPDSGVTRDQLSTPAGSATSPSATSVNPGDSGIAPPSAPEIPMGAPASDTAPDSAGQTMPLKSAEAAAPIPTEEETPAHLAMEQTVQADVPIWEQPDKVVPVESAQTASSPRLASSKSIEDLLAETGAPNLEPEKTPSLIISHHKPRSGGAGKAVLSILLLLVLAAVALDLLLDAEIITSLGGLDVPHTNFL